MNTFLVKLVMMPLVIAAVTQISKKWGNAIGGLVASLPWVGGPIIFFIAWERGAEFAISAIPGVMLGLIGWLTFCLTYAIAGRKLNPFWSLISGYIAYLITGFLLNLFAKFFILEFWVIATVVLVIVTFKIFPKFEVQTSNERKPLKYDIPLRMIMITAFVVGITYFAELLGPAWSGILTPFPIMTAVLAIFTHYGQGIGATTVILKGLLLGIFGFVAFMYLLSFNLPHMSIISAFLISITVNLLITFAMKFMIYKV